MAIDKKSASFVQALCMGRIEEEIVLPFPEIAAPERETVAQVAASVRQLLEPRVNEFRKWDVAGELPREFVEEMKGFGLFGLVVPEEYGGLGFAARPIHARSRRSRAGTPRRR